MLDVLLKLRHFFNYPEPLVWGERRIYWKIDFDTRWGKKKKFAQIINGYLLIRYVESNLLLMIDVCIHTYT